MAFPETQRTPQKRTSAAGGVVGGAPISSVSEAAIAVASAAVMTWSTWSKANPWRLSMWRSRRNQSFGNEDELGERPPRLDRRMAAKPWESRGRASTDQRDLPIKTVEIDSSQPYSYLAPNFRRSNQPQFPQQHQRSNSQCHASPLHRAHQNLHQSPPVSPSSSKTRPLQVRSASPRCVREERSYHTAQTPSLRSNYHYNGSLQQHTRDTISGAGGAMPNYMAATESAKARARLKIAPRQRPSTPERGVGSFKKRLSLPVPNPYLFFLLYGQPWW